MSFAKDYRYCENKVSLPMVDGEVQFLAYNKKETRHEITFRFINAPTAGTVTVACRPYGSDEFQDIDLLTAVSLTEMIFTEVAGTVEEFKLTFAGVTAPAESFAIMTDSAS